MFGTLNTNLPEDLSLYAELAPYLDQLNLMTYDMTGAYPDGRPYEGWLSWHHTPIYNPRSGEYWRTPTSIDDTVKAYQVAGVPAHELGIGIGVYGTCWSGSVTGPRQEFGDSRRIASDNVISYNNIVRFYDLPEAWRWDDGAAVPYMSFSEPPGPQGCTFISFDNGASVQTKGDYVKAQGLGGAILWNINEGYIPSRLQGQRNPLLVATRQGFLE
ncbi:MAG: glycosyl hydrolase family 18 protein [Trueperaceae bacterium]